MKKNIYNELFTVVTHCIQNNNLQQGIIGIQIPPFVTTEHLDQLQVDLMTLPQLMIFDLQMVLVPPPLTGIFHAHNQTDVESIGRRVFRDQLDGVRYNRLYVALYWDDLGKANAEKHDAFVCLKEQTPGRYIISVVKD